MVMGSFFSICVYANSIDHSQAQIKSSKSIYLTTEYLSLWTSGLVPNQEYQLTATFLDQNRVQWSSNASFVTDPAGNIDFNSTPIQGTYNVGDSQGLFWSMLPANSKKDRDVFNGGDRYEITVKLFFQNQLIGQDSFQIK